MDGNVGILIIGINGSIASHLTTGLFSILHDKNDTTGLVTELSDFQNLDLVPLNKLRIGGWDINTNSHDAVVKSMGIVDGDLFGLIEDDLSKVVVFDAISKGVTSHILSSQEGYSHGDSFSQKEAVDSLVANINTFKTENELDSVVIVNLSSTEPQIQEHDCYNSVEKFEKAITENSENITPIMRYFYAALITDSPIVNFTPNNALGIQALLELANKNRVPIAGNDGKTGQTLYKTVIAPMLKWRNLKLQGWFSLNILGNNDGRVLEDPEHKKTKISSKSKALAEIFQYDDFDHKVNIEYYPTRGDAKEAWDTIDFKGWMGREMSMKINWQGQDSILAAPLVIDLVRFIDCLHRDGEFGVSTCLSAFFKDPLNSKEHDFSEQMRNLRDHFETEKE